MTPSLVSASSLWSRCFGCVQSTEPWFLSTSVRVCNSQDKAFSLREDALLCPGQVHLLLHSELSYSCWHWLQLVGEAGNFLLLFSFFRDRILLCSPLVGNFQQPDLKTECKLLCCLAFPSLHLSLPHSSPVIGSWLCCSSGPPTSMSPGEGPRA